MGLQQFVVGLLVGLLIGGAGGYLIGAYAAVRDAAQERGAQAQVRADNPLDSVQTNPYEDVKTNPFE